MAYLQELHPELFFAIPRPGGIAKIDLPEDEVKVVGKGSKATVRSSKSTRSSRKSLLNANFMSNLTGYVSREQRIKKVLQSSPWIFFDDYSDLSKVSSPVQDTIDILAIVVTTVMLLAADYNDISNNHLRWTYSYLSCIKDESGHTPPNIKGIMNHIKLKNNEIDSFIEDDTVLSVNEVEEAHIEPDDNKEDAAAAPAEENAPADK